MYTTIQLRVHVSMQRILDRDLGRVFHFIEVRKPRYESISPPLT